MNFHVFFIVFLIFTMINKVILLDWRHHNQVKNKSFGFLVQAGYRPETHEFAKYVASVQFNNSHSCGGTIIKTNIILTAAHCMGPKVEEMRVVVGTPNRLARTKSIQIINIKKKVSHPYYYDDGFITKNDVALLVLKEDITIDDEGTAIMEVNDKPIVKSTNCVAAGWGRIYYEGPNTAEILYVNLSTLEPKDCERAVGLRHRKGMICTHDENDPEKGVNQGDSGGPLFCNNKVVGLTSFGYLTTPEKPDVFTDVYEYRDWILADMSPQLRSEVISLFGLIIILNNLLHFVM